MSHWPPKYTVRRSKRAKRVSLSIPHGKGLELVLPLNTSIEAGEVFLTAHRRWVEKHLKVEHIQCNDPIEFPQEACLPSLQKVWPIRYHHVHTPKKVSLSNHNDHLIFSGQMPSFASCVPPLNRWLRSLACQYLPDWLSQVSQEIHLPYHRVTIRTQKTLWGSCSSTKNISLNDRLMYLPYELVRYVLVHELCHTVYFDHSQRFWQLVHRFVPNYKNYIAAIQDHSLHIPEYLRA